MKSEEQPSRPSETPLAKRPLTAEQLDRLMEQVREFQQQDRERRAVPRTRDEEVLARLD